MHVTFFSEIGNKFDTFDIKALILKSTPVDLIIGRFTIKKYNILDTVPSQLGDKLLIPSVDPTLKCNKIQCDCLSDSPLTPILKPQTVSLSCSLLASPTVESQNLLGGFLPDDDEIDHDKSDTFKPWLP